MPGATVCSVVVAGEGRSWNVPSPMPTRKYDEPSGAISRARSCAELFDWISSVPPGVIPTVIGDGDGDVTTIVLIAYPCAFTVTRYWPGARSSLTGSGVWLKRKPMPAT